MTASIRPLVAGNWKMNGRLESIAEIGALAAEMKKARGLNCDVMICPPAPYLHPFQDALRAGDILIGGQDCAMRGDGAHTGDVSAQMLKDVGCDAVIVGHSERRTDHGETDAIVKAKAGAAHAAGLTAIVCIGESEDERNRDETLKVLGRQLAGSVPEGARASDTVIAYEPVWAIGTGRTPSLHDVKEAHVFVREALAARFGSQGAGMRILYGGSVKPANAAELMAVANVDGALVGGASLKAADFWGIIKTYT